MGVLRPLESTDADELASVVAANRDFLRPWEPTHAASYFTMQGQAQVIEDALARQAAGLMVPLVITDADALVGRININNIVRGAGQFAALGYWVSQDANGRGLGTAAVGEAVRMVFGPLHLHRLEAGTLVHNAASQRILIKNGFTEYGIAPRFIRIDGRWQDHRLFQLLNDDWSASD